MKKKITLFLFLVMLVTVSFSIAGCKKNKEVTKTFPETVANLSSYKLKGKLESVYPTGTKESSVTVYYHKPDLYRVELVMPNTLDKQVIVKNADGVFVIIPSIQKNFKVNSDWPLTSSYPYLLQSLSKDLLADQNAVVEKESDKTSYKVKAHLFDDAEDTYQKMIFDNKTGLPTEVLVYKNDDTLISRFIIESIDTNVEIDNNMFVVDSTLQTLKTLYDEAEEEFDRALSYPTYTPKGVTLKEEVTTGSDDNKQVILTYTGECNITILENYVTCHETVKTEYIDGDIYVSGGVAMIYSDNIIKFYENGIEYTLASNDLCMLELSMMGDSLRLVGEK